eukprot:6469036-Prymnesium_polylepis.1
MPRYPPKRGISYEKNAAGQQHEAGGRALHVLRGWAFPRLAARYSSREEHLVRVRHERHACNERRKNRDVCSHAARDSCSLRHAAARPAAARHARRADRCAALLLPLQPSALPGRLRLERAGVALHERGHGAE